MRRFVLVSVAGLVLAALAGWWSLSGTVRFEPRVAKTHPAAAKDQAPPRFEPAESVNGKQAFYDPLVIGPCNLSPIFEQDVSSQVDGLLDDIYVDLGRQVRKGEVLGRL